MNIVGVDAQRGDRHYYPVPSISSPRPPPAHHLTRRLS